MKLTKKSVDAAVYDREPVTRNGKTTYPQQIHWDDKLTGFGLRVYPTGKKSFVISYRTNGRKRIMTLTRYGLKTLEQARSMAKIKLGQAEDGEDPLEEKQRKAKGETVKDLCTAYMDLYAKEHKKEASWKDDERRINRYLLPAWGNIKAANIKHSDVAALHRKIGKKAPYSANRLAALISKMFNLARKWGFVEADSSNPARDIEHYKEEKRDRWVTPEELPFLMEAVNEESNDYARRGLWLYLLTGLRKNELLSAKWEYIDWERKELRVPNTKSGKVHYLPLSEAAISMLDDVPRIKNNPYILPGLKEGSHLVNIEKPWLRTRKKATIKIWAVHDSTADLIADLRKKLDRDPTIKEVQKATDFDLPTGVLDVRLHDLRRTVGSWLAQSGNSLHLIGRVLNHSNTSTTAIYARFAQDQVRNALEQHGQKIMGIAGQKPTANVVKLNSGKRKK
ncbi:MAG TPA: site-specific integrase [Phycisphaerales bacterium]|nr:prophage CP4-57 integrase [bacterium BMS3Abin11]HDZ68853.1 site-specific integrase [Phycisphaerales bacterium]